METAIYLVGTVAVAILYIFRSQIFGRKNQVTIDEIEQRVISWFVCILVIVTIIVLIYEVSK